MATSRKKQARPLTPLEIAYNKELHKIFREIADDWGGGHAKLEREGPGYIVVRLWSNVPPALKGSSAEANNGYAELRCLFNNGIPLIHIKCLEGRAPVWVSPVASAVIAVMTR